MDALLKGGLADGCWSMFGDFEYQNIVTSRTNKTGALDARGLHRTTVRLTTNCRNTQEIAETVAKLVGIHSPPISGVHGPIVQIEYFNSPDDLEDQLDDLIASLKERAFSSEQIILLTSGLGNEFNTTRQYGEWQLLNISKTKRERTPTDMEATLSVSSDSSPHTLRYSDVYDFQGLESELVILVLPVTEDRVVLGGAVTLPYEKHMRRVLYTGMSRAQKMLIIVANESYKKTLSLRQMLGPKLKKTP